MSFFGKCKAVLAALVLTSGVAAYAADNQVNQLLTAQAPVKLNAGQFYAGGNFVWVDADNDISAWILQGFGSYGITNELSVQAWIPLVHGEAGNADSTGIGDIRIGAQYKLAQWLKPEQFGQVNGSVVIGLPTGDDEVGAGGGLGGANVSSRSEFAFRASEVGVKSFGNVANGDLSVYHEIGFELASMDSHFFFQGTPAWSPNEQWTVVSEFNFDIGREFGFMWVPGVVFKGVKNLELGGGLIVGAGDASPNFGIVIKGTYVP